MRAAARSVALGVVPLLLLAGCSLPWSGPDAGTAATRVARQLASGKLTAAAFSSPDKVSQQYHAITAGLGGVDPTVRVDHVADTGDNRAEATLAWRWQLRGGSWRYTSTVPLQQRGDQWLARWHPSDVHPGLTSGQALSATTLPARRGDILGAHGTRIVRPRPVLRFGIDKTKVAKPKVGSSARALARLLGIDVAGYAKLARHSGPRAFVPAIVLRRHDVPPAVASGYHQIPGAVALADTMPLAPTRTFAAGLLGRVGQATAEIVKQSRGRVRPGDEVGLSGLQHRYDVRLAGTPGTRVGAVGPKHISRVLFTAKPVSGKALRTTLDPREQALAERLLSGVGPASALVAVRPSSGDIVAAASGPGSDGYDTATYGRYAPGSTFKIVSTLALLRSGLTPHSTVPCTPSRTVYGKTFTNDSEYPPSGLGEIPLTLALANSCNTAYISQHGRLHGDDLHQAAAALGFGVDHDVGFPAYFGQAPRPAGRTEAAADMIGQGRILASPLAMATVVASVRAGNAVVPRLLDGTDRPQASPAHPLTSKEDHELRTMMRAVVTTPTGTGAGLADVPGKPVIAKTGTAEFGSTPPLPTHAWMVAGQGDLAVAVFVDRGHTGAGTAGPVLEAFLRGR
ncbi:MAG: penicillin-binding transpeptidase domain-containing protein [Marmoricola sp.]